VVGVGVWYWHVDVAKYKLDTGAWLEGREERVLYLRWRGRRGIGSYYLVVGVICLSGL
jgi:hypothetical protein